MLFSNISLQSTVEHCRHCKEHEPSARVQHFIMCIECFELQHVGHGIPFLENMVSDLQMSGYLQLLSPKHPIFRSANGLSHPWHTHQIQLPACMLVSYSCSCLHFCAHGFQSRKKFQHHAATHAMLKSLVQANVAIMANVFVPAEPAHSNVSRLVRPASFTLSVDMHPHPPLPPGAALIILQLTP